MKFTSIFLVCFVLSQTGWSYSRFGETLCHQPGYKCLKIKRGDSWAQLYTDPVERDLVRRINRMNVFLEPNMIIAVPEKLKGLSINDVSPFAAFLPSGSQKQIYVALEKQAWAAYDYNGKLVKWGPLSAGSEKCLDQTEGCQTPTGAFSVTRKHGMDCVSNKFPQRMDGRRGGGEMPFCIFFYKGYALHGSSDLPGYPASYGCLRLFVEDAQWLNNEFVELPVDGKRGTQVIINDGQE